MSTEARSSWLAPFRTVATVPEQRWFATAMLVNALGNGLSVTVSALFFTRVLGVGITVYGIVLAVAAGCGLVVGPALGHLADRLDARGVYAALLVGQGVATLLCLLPGSAWLALSALVLATMAERGAAATRGALTARLVARSERVRFRAVVRSLVNAAGAAGAGAGALVLAVDTSLAYRLAVAANALTFLAAAAAIARCRATRAPAPVDAGSTQVEAGSAPAEVGPPASRGGALRDPGFLAITALNGVLILHAAIIGLALPLWVAARTDAPLWIVSVLVVLNTVGVVTLQVRVGRGVDDVPAAARAGRRAGLALAVGAVLLGLTGLTSGPVTVVLLVLAATAHLGGELWQAVAGWGLAFGLAPEQAQGQYQGVFNTGQDAATLLAPLLFAWIVDRGGPAGWGLLAVAFAVVAAVLPPIARRLLARSTIMRASPTNVA